MKIARLKKQAKLVTWIDGMIKKKDYRVYQN
jgi:hypothetical protein